MNFFKDPYRATLNERLTLWLIGGGALIIFASALTDAGDSRFSDLCPIHRILGLYCPGCGLTRASRSLFRLAFLRAFQYNPAIVFVAPYAAYRAVSIVLGMITKRQPVSNIPRWFINAVQVGFVALYLLLFVVRTASWLYPDINPDRFLLPLIDDGCDGCRN